MRPWSRVPNDLWKWDPALPGLPPAERATFASLFLVSRHQEPYLGFLGYIRKRQLRPLSLRELADATEIPRSTLRRHLASLRRDGLVVATIEEHLFLPLVIRVEHRLARNGATDASPQRSNTTSRASVENQEALFDSVSQIGTEAVHRGPPLPLRSREEKTTYVPSTSSVVENEDGVAFVGDYSQLVPDEVDHPDARYLLGKLAKSDRRWHRFLTHPRDQRSLRRLHRESPAALLEALRQATETSTSIANPGAWLTKTVPAIATDLEAAR